MIFIHMNGDYCDDNDTCSCSSVVITNITIGVARMWRFGGSLRCLGEESGGGVGQGFTS